MLKWPTTSLPVFIPHLKNYKSSVEEKRREARDSETQSREEREVEAET